MICTAANSLWLAGCLFEAARYRRALRQVRVEQERLLLDLIRANASTQFGREHGFSSIRSVRDYQHAVPPRSFDEYGIYVDRAASGSHQVLTREPIRLFEPTSGSAAATKLIPYTTGLQRQFQRAIQTWIADLYLHRPDLMRGQAYWSVSPAAVTPHHTASGIPIGFEDDSEYVGGWQKRLVQATMAAPATLRRLTDIDAFQYATVLALVRSESLRIISVWNPTFLMVLLDRLPAYGDALLHDLELTMGNRRRADVLRAALRARTGAERHAILWPKLGLISCWADANAAAAADALRRQFRHAEVQPKGLIATEGFVSLPMIGLEGSLLAVRSHFFEFAEIGRVDRAPSLAHELERGRFYEVLLSTAGGLYRYRLRDVIEVLGHVHECPVMRFVGRDGYVSDWFGEKLNEAHVGRVLAEALERAGVKASFAMLACDSTLPAYVLYIDPADAAVTDESLEVITQRVDAMLRQNFHYDHARRHGQLAGVRVFRARGAGATYLATRVRAGQRAGDVKPLALDRGNGWSERFEGLLVPQRDERIHA